MKMQVTEIRGKIERQIECGRSDSLSSSSIKKFLWMMSDYTDCITDLTIVS